VDPAQTYRMYATVAADMAADTIDPGIRASLLKMAEALRGLADKEEGGSVQQQQQQQQPQPDDDDV
jgi:hypothetical protein